MKRLLLLALLLLFAANARAATCHVVGPTGTGSGTSFSSPMAMPSSNGWVRGHVYFFLPGSYNKLQLGTPVSSTTLITILRATSADHGQSGSPSGCSPAVDTGYVDSTMGQPAGPANIKLLEGLTSYYVVDGAYHPSNWYTNGGGLNVQTGYGFYVNMNIACAPGTCWALNVDNGLGISNITVKNVGIYGRGDAVSDTSSDFAIRFVQSGGNHTFSYIGMYNISCSFIQARNADNITVDHVWGEHNHATSANHAEPITVAAANHWTVRYSVFKDIEGTGGIVNLSDGTHGLVSDDWNIYGNLFFVQPGNPTGRSGMGNGILSCINDQLSTNWRFVNNTVAYMPGFTRIYFIASSGNCAGQTGLLVKDNLWYSNAFAGSANHAVASLSNFDYNSYLQTTTNDTGVNTINQPAGASPFVTATPAVGSDFFLAVNTNVTPWLNLNGTIAGNATDGSGTTRALSRGAYEKIGAAASLSITPSPVAFGNQNIGSTGSVTATLTNVGTASATLSGITLTPSVFTNGNTGLGGQCTNTSVLAASASCTILVKFAPTAQTTYNGTLTVTGTVGTSVALSGTGTNAISIPGIPTNVTATASSSSAIVSWTASLGTPTGYKVNRATVSGGPYTLVATLGLLTSYTDPSLANGTYYYVITAFNSAGTSANSNEASVTIASVADANFAPASLFFGTINQGATGKQTTTVTSNGTSTLTLASSSAITISGANAADFSVDGATTCANGASYTPGTSCTVVVAFVPSTTTAETATLCVVSNALTSPDCITMTGTGASPASVSPTSLNFGNVYKNRISASQTVTFTNNSGGTISFTSIAVSTGDSTQFVKGTDACGASVANGSTCTVAVTFQPTSSGQKASALVFTFTPGTGSPISVTLRGQSNSHKVLKVGSAVKYSLPGGFEVKKAIWRGRCVKGPEGNI